MKIALTTVMMEVIGYTIALTADDTYDWAHRPGNERPCSELAGRPFTAEVDQSGLAAFDGPDAPADEIEACISDHRPGRCGHLWPYIERCER